MRTAVRTHSAPALAAFAVCGALLISFALFAPLSFSLNTAVATTPQLHVWWPTDGARVEGTQPLKAVVDGHAIEEYRMYWQVGDGRRTEMWNSYDEAPHKAAVIDFSSWTWLGDGPYPITLTAVEQRSRREIARTTVHVHVGNAMQSTDSIDVWWPTAGATLAGEQPFKARLASRGLEEYAMYVQVPGGAIIRMDDSYEDAPHKRALIDVSAWGPGAHDVVFVANDERGHELARHRLLITADGGAGAASPEDGTDAPDATLASASGESDAPLPPVQVSSRYYVDPNSPAARQAAKWRQSKPYEASLMDILAAQPVAQWLGGWNADVRADVSRTVDAASAAGSVPIFIAYNIPNRDCSGGHSAGGVASANAYRAWISAIADGIGGAEAIVVLEPDALAGMECLSSGAQQERFELLNSAVETLGTSGKVAVYIDAGHSSWVPADKMAGLLVKAGVSKASGFALNVSNFQTTADSVAYGERVASAARAHTGRAEHFVIDTSRNGRGPSGDEWCNPSGRGLGRVPQPGNNHALVDAYLWLKTPGESDGPCNGGPNAGVWWPEYAVGLVERRAF
ncbi:hypothetical protein COU20_02845 [Candidatus Kaiserbacteria bacterium CG10_big_fil_rev_8_21_14_0_10_59_10]|uniref:Glucanase n=1 Tax=Candidatus Kaiserbacteria bacterium CG10_big_fil_rev_8_21_14_0_10_59_10 TaxID=1974612 RepID=A0A2H0U7D6_9BACT|nr:MAG: hypothetical protein COU20_02845 [Candidatus Kaiserbacteria bacterium CG10_big_fil_rev_8_21_14_0_10_59_10]